MKIARFDEGATGLVIERDGSPAVIDVAGSLPALAHDHEAAARIVANAIGESGSGDWAPLIEQWDEVRPGLQALADAGSDELDGIEVRRLDDVTLQPPLPSVRARTFALGANFTSHMVSAAEYWTAPGRAISFPYTTDPEETRTIRHAEGPSGFHVLPETIIGPEGVVVPPVGMTKLDYEAEVAVLLGRGGRYLDADDVVIWGYTAWNDFSLRDAALGLGPVFDRGPLIWALQKNFETGSSCGPWIVVDANAKINSLRMKTWINGEIRQDGNTDEMVFGFADTAAHLSQFISLRSGDIIASGTPAGTAGESGADGRFLVDGDVVEVDIEGVGGILRNRVEMP
jgi:2-keto-4-pentenoate hydratase/2-oxohepta-3-ene-1,7-dioic acid hydratase in catechol pathway